MQKSSKSKLHYFQFDPSDWFEVLMMEDKAAGKRFKEMILRLSKSEAPEGTPEAKMISVVTEFREKQRQRVMARWNRNEEKAEELPPPPPPPPPPAPRPRPPMQRPQQKGPPQMEDVYDFCDANHFPAPFGREWYEYQESKGWNTMRMPWQSALRGFCQRKMKD